MPDTTTYEHAPHMRSLTFTSLFRKDQVLLLDGRRYLQTMPSAAEHRIWDKLDLEVDLSWSAERDEDFDGAVVCTARPVRSEDNLFDQDHFRLSIHGSMQHIPYDSVVHKATFEVQPTSPELASQCDLSLFEGSQVDKIDTARSYAYAYKEDVTARTRYHQKSQIWISSRVQGGEVEVGDEKYRFDAMMDDVVTRVVGTAEIPLDLPASLVSRIDPASNVGLLTRICPLIEVTFHPTKQLHPQEASDASSSNGSATYADILDGRQFLMVQSSVDCFSGRRALSSVMHDLSTGEPLGYTVEGYRLINGLEGGQGREAESLNWSTCHDSLKEILDPPSKRSPNVRRIKKSTRTEYPKDWYQYEQHLPGKDGRVKQVQGFTLTTLGMRTDAEKPSRGVLSLCVSDDEGEPVPWDIADQEDTDPEGLKSQLSIMGWEKASRWRRAPASDIPGRHC